MEYRPWRFLKFVGQAAEAGWSVQHLSPGTQQVAMSGAFGGSILAQARRQVGFGQEPAPESDRADTPQPLAPVVSVTTGRASWEPGSSSHCVLKPLPSTTSPDSPSAGLSTLNTAFNLTTKWVSLFSFTFRQCAWITVARTKAR